MSEKPKAKVISFPQQKSETPQVKQENSSLNELKAILLGDLQDNSLALPNDALPIPEVGSSPITVNFTFHGGSHQIAGGDINAAGIDALKPRTLTHKPSYINSKQKSQLLALRDDIVAKSDLCGFPKHPGTVMKGLNMAMGVDSYHNIPLEDFATAKAHLEAFVAAYDKHLAISSKELSYRSALWDAIKAAQLLLPAENDLNEHISQTIHIDSLATIHILDLIELHNLTVSSAF